MEKNVKKFEVVEADEEAIFISLDDALFYEEVPRVELEKYRELTAQTCVDHMVAEALTRVLNVSLPNDQGWYNGSKGRK